MTDPLRTAIAAALAPVQEASEASAPAGPAARIMIATPTYDCTMHWRYVESLMSAMLLCAVNGVELELEIAARFSLVQYARNHLAQRFLDEPQYSHILWLDSDLGFDPRGIMRLLSHGKDVVAGIYPVKRDPGWFPFEPTGRKDGALLEAEVVPTGFLLVSRRAMEAVAATVPSYSHFHEGREYVTKHLFDLELTERKGKQVLLGEDVVLSHRLRKAGFDIWVDPSIGFRHCGMHEWGGHLGKELERWAKEGIEAFPKRVTESSAA